MNKVYPHGIAKNFEVIKKANGLTGRPFDQRQAVRGWPEHGPPHGSRQGWRRLRDVALVGRAIRVVAVAAALSAGTCAFVGSGDLRRAAGRGAGRVVSQNCVQRTRDSIATASASPRGRERALSLEAAPVSRCVYCVASAWVACGVAAPGYPREGVGSKRSPGSSPSLNSNQTCVSFDRDLQRSGLRRRAPGGRKPRGQPERSRFRTVLRAAG